RAQSQERPPGDLHRVDQGGWKAGWKEARDEVLVVADRGAHDVGRRGLEGKWRDGVQLREKRRRPGREGEGNKRRGDLHRSRRAVTDLIPFTTRPPRGSLYQKWSTCPSAVPTM